MRNLTNRQIGMLRVPLFVGRVVTEVALLDAFWPDTKSGRTNGRRQLRWLCASELLEAFAIHGKPVRRVSLLYEWAPGEPEPNFAWLSQVSKERWRVPIRPMRIYTATVRARNIFGAQARQRVHSLGGLSHDAAVSLIYLHMLRSTPETANRWRSEDERLLGESFGQAQADACLVGDDGQPHTAVEFAGEYEPSRFEHFHNTFAAREIKYQIWSAGS